MDISSEMIRLVPDGPALPVQGDGSRLPFADGSIDALILVNMFLFPAEVDRVLAATGVVVWVNSRGPETPIHLTADEVDQALPGPVGRRLVERRLGHLVGALAGMISANHLIPIALVGISR